MLFWSVVPALAADAIVGGIVTPMVAVDLPGDDYDGEDKVETHIWARAFASGELPRGDRWFLEARVQHHLLFGHDVRACPPGGGGTDAWCPEGWWDGTLGDSGWDGKIGGPVRARVGVLTERWGKLDLLPVADVLNPRDGRSGLITPLDYAKLPIPMAVVSIESEVVRAETVYIPFSTADRFWIRDQDWAFVRPGMLEDQLNLISTTGGWGGENLTILNSARTSIATTSVSERRLSDQALALQNLPEAALANGEIAERIELHASNVDLAVMGGYLRSRQPLSVIDPVLQGVLRDPQTEPSSLTTVLSQGPVDITWPRTAVVGADLSAVVGPLQVRADTLYQTARPVRTHFGGGQVVPQLGAGIGMDYVRGSTFFATIESRWLHLFDAPNQLLLATEDQVQLAAGARVSLARGALPIQLGGMYDFSFREYLIRPSVGYRVSDHLSVDLGAQILGGATAPPATLVDALTYEGGPLSYFSQNDTVTLSVSLIR